MSLIRTNAYSQSQWDHYTFRRTLSGSTATFTIGFPGGVQDRFTGAPSLTSWAPAKANGATLTRSGWTYTYTAPDGTTITFIDPTWSGEAGFPTTSFCSDATQTSCDLVPESIDFPDGRSIAFDFTLYDMPDGSGGTAYEYRLAKVTNGFGYAVGFAYQDDSYSYGSPPSTAWRARSRAGRNHGGGAPLSGWLLAKLCGWTNSWRNQGLALPSKHCPSQASSARTSSRRPASAEQIA
jgi:hypothetical protein